MIVHRAIRRCVKRTERLANSAPIIKAAVIGYRPVDHRCHQKQITITTITRSDAFLFIFPSLSHPPIFRVNDVKQQPPRRKLNSIPTLRDGGNC